MFNLFIKFLSKNSCCNTLVCDLYHKWQSVGRALRKLLCHIMEHIPWKETATLMIKSLNCYGSKASSIFSPFFPCKEPAL